MKQKLQAVEGQLDLRAARHPWAAEFLAMLDDQCGTATSDLARRHSRLAHLGGNRRQQSAAALAVLRQLEADGCIKKMDDEKPIAWVLVVSSA